MPYLGSQKLSSFSALNNGNKMPLIFLISDMGKSREYQIVVNDSATASAFLFVTLENFKKLRSGTCTVLPYFLQLNCRGYYFLFRYYFWGRGL